MSLDINRELANYLKIDLKQVNDTVTLLDEGNTIPFIARYRKEVTGGLEDTVIRDLAERLEYLRTLSARKEDVARLIRESLELEENAELPDNLAAEIEAATTMQRLDDLYRPYRPKRRTRAMMAREKGLGELAELIFLQKVNAQELEEMIDNHFLNPQKDVNTREEAIAGAQDIIAEDIADDAEYRKAIRNKYITNGLIVTKAVKEDIESVYEMYYDYQEPFKDMANHRVLAVNRGEKEKILNVKIEMADIEMDEFLVSMVTNRKNLKNEDLCFDIIQEAIKDSFHRLMFPSIERELRNALTEKAEDEAIDVFAMNLNPLLMQPPVNNANVIAIDPGFRTGCKVAVLDNTGKLLDYTTIFPTEPRKEIKKSQNTLAQLIDKYHINVIAIGNGTASRETEQVVADLIKEMAKEDLGYIIVNEAGASIYSASKVGQQEFPDLDVSIRGAVSIGRRLQDPLAELVKIEPHHIGVGQYQHDLNQTKLNESLKVVVEDVVNSVGIDLNTASPSLLSYVAGISNKVATNIVEYREENKRYTKRSELKKVKGLGPKTYEQCAGFLRIRDGKEPLDNTGVHPESYHIAKEILKEKNQGRSISEFAAEYGAGEATIKDILKELKNPGRDPREELEKPILRSDVLKIEDLSEGMVLKGTVRNVVDFGAFVDIGVTQDGLVHISELANQFVKHPKDVVQIGDIVNVRIIGIDASKDRISLSMKDI